MSRRHYKYLCIFVIFIFCAVQGYQNFLFSDSFGQLIALRDWDDFAFQHSISRLHIAFTSSDYRPVITSSAYGYGFFFWLLHSLAMLPAFLFQSTTSLIVTPRLLSMLFMVITFIFSLKIFELYSPRNYTSKFCFLLALMAFPVLSYFALRFGTVAQVTMFNTITLYYVVRHHVWTLKKLSILALLCGATIGTQLPGAFVLLPVALKLASDYEYKVNKHSIRHGSFFIVILFFLAFTLTTPTWLLYFNDRSLFQNFANTLQFYLNLVAQNYSTNRMSAEEGFLGGIILPIGGVVSYSIIALSNIASLVKQPRKWFFIVLPAFIIQFFLIFRVGHGAWFVMNYYSAWFMVFLLPFFVLPESLNMKMILFGIFTLFLVFCYLTTSFVSTDFSASVSFFPLENFQKQNSDLIRNSIKVHDILKKKLIISKTKNTFIIYDYRVLLPYNDLDGLKNLKLVLNWNNVSARKFDQAPDYIISHSASIEHMTESDFEKRLQELLLLPAWATPEVINKTYRNTRKELLRLINKGKFRGYSFKKEIIENVYLFTRIQP